MHAPAPEDKERRSPGDEDQRTEARIVERLASGDPAIETAGIQVSVAHGVVTLAGVTDSEESIAQIETQVAALPGVRDVDNQLKVGQI